MKKYSALVALSAIAIVCVVVLLVTKFNRVSYPSIEDPDYTFAAETTGSYYPVETDPWEALETTVLPENAETVPAFAEDSTTASGSSDTTDFSQAATTRPVTTRPTPTTAVDKVTEAAAQISTTVTQAVAQVNTAFNEAFKMPKAPKYIPKYTETGIDFSKASLASYMYDPEGGYYYTNDKDCWQKNFGYNQVYDKLAVVGQMYYDTVRTTFNYGGKDWLIQIWKGQYGYYFVGGEVGVYTKKQGSPSNTYVCADKEDWLNMEMAFVWDENKSGNYKTIFARPYDKYWWCTGFVIGFPSRSIVNSRAEFRLIVHITFKDEAMTNAFCTAFEKNGFKRKFVLDNNNDLDCFVQVGNDVAFVWQNINQHII